MQSHIIKFLIILIFTFIPLFIVVPKTLAQAPELIVSYSSSEMTGFVVSATGTPIQAGLWVRWEDRLGNVRYTQTYSGGRYVFQSWQLLTDSERQRQHNTMIDTDFDGVADASMASTDDYSSFGCIENPHKITVIKPYNWSGSFSNETYGVTNRGINNDLLTDTFPTITYTPGPNSASCIGNLQVNKTSVNVGDTFQATISIRNNNAYGTWTAENNFRLGRWDNNEWAFPDGNSDRVYLQSPVKGGDTYTFSFPVRAPNTAGNRTLSVRMVQDGREWFGEVCSSQTITVNNLPPIVPKINGITVTNNGGSGNAVRTSGSKTDQAGTGYNNPLTITLSAEGGKNGNNTPSPSTFYVAFYKQSTGAISSDFINSATNRLADPTNGVLLAYDETNKRCGGSHCVFDPIKDQWIKLNGDPIIEANGYPIRNSSTTFYTVFPGNSQNYSAERQWRINFDRSFGTKSMFTSAYVFDSNGKSAFIGGDIPPNQ